ncbi:iron-sulfur cluster co-chaperone protein HscB [Amyelois transitella]|uniref:iron-sulfur cluster co-chaperone protein HscB n=1 Tax=Amyelois transitella TaxID=680683 RepID=UPI00298F91B3|nr:iron-sulfur cluster co-chaperone protein HscB [Amyelois transitella]
MISANSMNIGRLFTINVLKRSMSRQILQLSCWSCGKDTKTLVSNLFCPNCNTLQKPKKEDNYFKVLGVKETYDLNENNLAKRYKDLQKYLHPDKFGARDKAEREVSEEYSSLVNEAYKTLLEPMARGIYMLKLKGKSIPETTEVDNAFLMEIMEKNEEVENAETEEEIMKLNQENKAVINDLQKKVSAAFFEGDLEKVVKLLSEMKYYTSIDSQIQGMIRNKGIIR